MVKQDVTDVKLKYIKNLTIFILLKDKKSFIFK